MGLEGFQVLRGGRSELPLHRGGRTMETVKEQWEQLCELARVEQDPARFLKLIEEIDRLLDQKQKRLEQQRKRGSETSG